MQPALSVRLVSLVVTLGSLLCSTHTTSHAQTHSLKLCAETLHKTRQVNRERTPTNVSAGLFPSLNPTYQKLQQAYQDWTECVKGQRAPLEPFKTLSGQAYDAASLTGKIVVINFWFTSCTPCRAEFPAFNKLVAEYKGKNVLFLGFATDSADRLRPSFFDKNRFDFQIIADAQNLANSFSVMGYPTTYIVDQQGLIRQAWIGFGGADMDKLAPYYKAKSATDNLLTTNGK